MNVTSLRFVEEVTLHKLSHFLPAQNPLKDFVHHNTLHAFQDKDFFTALQESSEIFGYKTFLLCKKVGSNAINSFEPIEGKTSNSPVTPKCLIDQVRIASCNSLVPATTG